MPNQAECSAQIQIKDEEVLRSVESYTRDQTWSKSEQTLYVSWDRIL